MAINYDHLIDQFGTKRIDDALLERFERLTGRKPHLLLRRGTFFSHRWVTYFRIAAFTVMLMVSMFLLQGTEFDLGSLRTEETFLPLHWQRSFFRFNAFGSHDTLRFHSMVTRCIRLPSRHSTHWSVLQSRKPWKSQRKLNSVWLQMMRNSSSSLLSNSNNATLSPIRMPRILSLAVSSRRKLSSSRISILSGELSLDRSLKPHQLAHKVDFSPQRSFLPKRCQNFPIDYCSSIATNFRFQAWVRSSVPCSSFSFDQILTSNSASSVTMSESGTSLLFKLHPLSLHLSLKSSAPRPTSLA